MPLKNQSTKRHQPRPITQERPECPERFSSWCLRLAVRAIQRDRIEARSQKVHARHTPRPATQNWQGQRAHGREIN